MIAASFDFLGSRIQFKNRRFIQDVAKFNPLILINAYSFFDCVFFFADSIFYIFALVVASCIVNWAFGPDLACCIVPCLSCVFIKERMFRYCARIAMIGWLYLLLLEVLFLHKYSGVMRLATVVLVSTLYTVVAFWVRAGEY